MQYQIRHEVHAQARPHLLTFNELIEAKEHDFPVELLIWEGLRLEHTSERIRCPVG